MEYCPHCMQPTSGKVCRHCGKSVDHMTEQHQLPLGTVMTGSGGLRTYQTGAVLGQGGFGITYIAMELGSHRRVAIKEYFPIQCAQRSEDHVTVAAKPEKERLYQGGMNSFLEEARMLASQDDLPSVVRVLDYFKANNTAYLVMEYLDGVTLQQKMKKEGKLPAQEFLAKLPPLLHDLEKLHQSGVIHRDISPDNLMWMPNGTIKLLDFGCARSIEDGKSMTVLLKQGFAPVEQYQTRGQGPWTDVYALSATIYYCLTGIVPPNAVERLDNDTLQPPTALGVALTEEQETALLWGLTVQPKSRPVSMEVFAKRLFGTPAPIPDSEPVPGPKPEPAPDPKPGPGPTMDTESEVGAKGRVLFRKTGKKTPAGTEKQEQAKTGKKKKWWLFAVGAAVGLVIIVIIVVSLNRNMGEVPTSSPAVNQGSAPPSPSVSVKPSQQVKEPDIIEGTTEDGYTYTLNKDTNEVTITGYTGSYGSGVLVLPDEVDGAVVTAIGQEAFKGQTGLVSIYLPENLASIGNRAFQNCSELRDIYIFQNAEMGSSVCAGCDKLACLVKGDDSFKVSGWPSGCLIYTHGMDTGAGALSYVDVLDDGVIYGITKDKQVVVMNVPAGLTEVVVVETVLSYPVTWMYEKALENAEDGVTIYMAEQMAFPYELLEAATWELKDDAENLGLSFYWYMSCYLAYMTNENRKDGEPEAQPVLEYVRAAEIRAEELAESYDSMRPDGSKWGTLLDELSIDWSYGSCWRARLDAETGDLEGKLKDIAEDWALPEEDYDNKYYTELGAAVCIPGDGKVYLCCIANIPG